MAQRIVTGALLVLLVTVMMYFGGAVMGAALLIALCFAMYEEYHALAVAGHRPVAWPTWAGMALTIPLVVLAGTQVLLPLILLVCLATIICVVFREEPKLEDTALSVLPLFTILLPGMCMMAMAMLQPKALQVVLLAMTFAIPVVGDTFAFFVGSRVRGPKLCPAVSPNKTISGAVAGLVGSLTAALLVGLIAYWCVSTETLAILPSWWQYCIIGVMGGVAGQMGDLFASLVKRHSGLKDFSNLFPGHGGMLDRLDSILFAALVVFAYWVLATM